MPGNRVPNLCLAETFYQNDEGTMCRAQSASPGPINDRTCNAQDEYKFQYELNILASGAMNFANRFIKDANVRSEYLKRADLFAQKLVFAVKNGNVTAKEAAQRANDMRNSLLDVARLKSSDIGRAIAESLKATGLTLAEAQEKYALKRFGKTFSQLVDSQKGQVYMDIVEASGRARPSATKSALRWGKLGKGLLVLSIGLVAYDIYAAEDKSKAVAVGGASLGGGFLGGAAGGAGAGLFCGPGAPSCSGVGVIVGGGLGALGIGSLVDWLWD